MPFKSLLNISFAKNPWIYETHLFMPLSLGFDKSFLKRSMFCQPQWSALDFLFLSATVQQPSLAFLGTVSDLFFHAIAMLSFLLLSRIHQQPQLLKRIEHQQFQRQRGHWDKLSKFKGLLERQQGRNLGFYTMIIVNASIKIRMFSCSVSLLQLVSFLIFLKKYFVLKSIL